MHNNYFKISEELLNRLKNGDEKALGEIYSHCREPLLIIAHGILNNWEEAEDVVQEAFIKLLKAKRGLKEDTVLEGYLYTLVKNLCISSLRKKQLLNKRLALFSYGLSLCDVSNPLENAELALKIGNAIDGLKGSQRKCFISIYLEDQSHLDIAKGLGINMQVSKNYVSMALKELRNSLKSELD
jgi:RNA polymerase sigma factor (sigma-70 family)